MGNTLAVILAGGQGKRMGKLCLHRPKPALPFAGNYRVIDFALSNCLHSGIGNVAVLSDYQRSYMANYLRQWIKGQKIDEDFAMDVLEANSHYLGTADAVYQNLEYLRKKGAETIAVLAADHVYKMDYREMLSFHEANKADATVAVVSMPPEKAKRFGTVSVAVDNRILNFVEKAETPQSNLVSMGIYIFNLEALTKHLCGDAKKPTSVHDFGYSIIPEMVRQDRTFAYQFQGYWRDIGTTEAYFETNMELARQQSTFSLNGTWPIITANKEMALPKFSSEGNIVNSIISPGCIIKGRVEHSVISSGVWVGEDAIIKDSVLMANVFIGPDSRVESSIIDEGVSVGRSCLIGAINSQPIIHNKITILEKDMVVPSCTNIGRDETEFLINEITQYMSTPKDTETSYALAKY